MQKNPRPDMEHITETNCPKNKNHKIKWSMVLQNKIIKLI